MELKVKTAQPTKARTEPDDDEDEIVNDSLGEVTPADSTGVDEEKETGEAKKENFPTRED